MYGRAEGPRTGRFATFTFREVADTLIEVGRGASFRDATSRARRAAKRDGSDSPNKPNLVMDWLDTFGALVVEHHERSLTTWPAVIAVDSKPLRKRGFDEERGRSIDAENGEVFAVMDMATGRRGGSPMLLRLAGGKDAVSWLAFFAEADLGGAPAWIVTDQDLGIEKAVAIAFPNAIHYRCEGHLLRNAIAAYEADKQPDWVRKRPDAQDSL